MIALITGGSGNGKSRYAERLMEALAPGEKVYLATLHAQDDESRRRVARHRAQRADAAYRTIERWKDLENAGIERGESVLLECVPNWLAGEMFDGGDVRRMGGALERLAQRCANLTIVTQDVFRDAEPYLNETHAYMRALAKLNAQAAAMSDYAAEIVAGLPAVLKGYEPLERKRLCCQEAGNVKLYIGGAYEGQLELARRENPEAVIHADFQETVREALARGEDPCALARTLCAQEPEAVVVSDEVGAGIVPLRKEDRVWREAVGRALCEIAEHAESVTRVTCGIGVRIR